MFALSALNGYAQGVATRNVIATPRGKPSGLPFHAHFTDVAQAAGLHAPVICGPTDHKTWIIEAVGCGAAFVDYDNDGWMDIFLLSGTTVEGSAGATNRLYRNNRDGTFTDVTEKAGLQKTGWASAVTVGDYNNDGFEDLFVTYWGQNVLYRNNGDGTFTDVTRQAGLLHEGTRWGSGCAFVDYNRDGHLDLFVANYLDFAFTKDRSAEFCNWKGVSVMCGPRGLPPGLPAALSEQRGRDVYGCQRRIRSAEGERQLHDDRGRSRFQRRWLARYLCGLRFHTKLPAAKQP